MSVESIITENLDIWTSAIKTKSASGRGSSSKLELYGIKKLRELILELAIRGKLVAQNPNDEPARELLKKTVAQKEVLLSQGKIKKSRKLGETNNGEVPFELPIGWEWVLIDQLGHDLGQEKPNSTFSYIDVGCIDKANGVIKEPGVLNAEDAPSRARKLVKRGCILYSTVRPYLLNIAVVEEDIFPKPIASTAFAVIQPFDGINSSYIYRYLRSPTFVSYVESVQTGVAYPAINDKQFYSGLFPLPPQEEQDRIVAKVDELMALCDQLESQTEASIEAHQTLVKSLLETLTNAKNAEELNENWQRISAHFDVLFTTEDSIDQLKQTILQLAVMGKLVKQDPNDEPASKLLERIAVEKEKLIKDKKIKKQKPLPSISEDEIPFQLPHGWEWCRLPDIGDLNRGKSKHRPRNDKILYEGGTIPLVQTGDVARANGVVTTFTSLYNQVGVEQSRLWPKGTLCITIAANIADTAVLGFDACFPDSVVGFTPYLDDVDVKYIDYYLRTAKGRLEEFAPSTAQKNINLEILSNLLVPLPPKKKILDTVRMIETLFSIVEKLSDKFTLNAATNLKLADSLCKDFTE